MLGHYGEGALYVENVKWCSPIVMPRSASRILLEVTDVRVERVQDISEADAIAGGLEAIAKEGSLIKYGIPGTDDFGWRSDWSVASRVAYRRLWESIHAVGSWDDNPWVWVVEFRRIEA